MTRELDALVAERVMKLSYILFDGTDKDAEELIPAYSTDISAAWLVVEKMEEQDLPLKMYSVIPSSDANVYVVRFGSAHTATEFTAPEAICKAALMAVGE